MKYFLFFSFAFVAMIFLNQGCKPEQVTALPTVSSVSPTSITQSSCATGGNVSKDGGATVTERGICYATTANPTTANNKVADSGTGTGTFATNITGLSANTIYHVRAYAVNSQGIAYGEDLSFTTLTQTSSIPTVTTTSVSSITENSCATGGNVTSDGGLSVLERGICYSTSPNPTTSNQKVTSGSGIGSFSVTLTGLSSNSTYYVKAYAINSSGTGYGNEISFTTDNPTATDIDGNVYHTVLIGGKLWFKSNLNVTRYRDGAPISTGLNGTQWASTNSGAYASSNGLPSNDAVYGKLYNQWAVSDSRHICPDGWHEPGYSELQNLVSGVGGITSAGILKATNYWDSPNTGTTNSFGFTALPAGYRDQNGSGYMEFGQSIRFWSKTNDGTNNYWTLGLFYNMAEGQFYPNNPNLGASCRCVQD